MDEVIDVEARFDSSGSIRPLAFIWHGQRYPVTDQGRQWEQADEFHVLVRSGDDQVFELAYLRQLGAWRLRRTPAHFSPARFI
jgi:hypothetical protein